MKNLGFLLLFAFFSNLSFSQNYTTKIYTTKDGLALNQTHRVFQDDKGFLWIAYMTGNWQIFDDKKFTSIRNKGAYGFGDFQISGDDVYTIAEFGYFAIHNYEAKFYKIDSSLFQVKNPAGYTNRNRAVLNKKGEDFIIKYKPLIVGGDQIETLNDTIYKLYKNKITRIPIKDFRNDTTVHFNFLPVLNDEVWITVHKIKTYNCVGLYKIENDRLVKQDYFPKGEISKIYTDKFNLTWIAYQSPLTSEYHIVLLQDSKFAKDYNLGVQRDIRLRLRTDEKGNLWIPNISGLIKIDPKKDAPEFFEDKGREIKTIQQQWEEFGKMYMLAESCDENYYAIAITKNNEILIGNKIFTEESGFKKIIDEKLFGANRLLQIFIDAEKNIWYVGNGLVKLSPTPVETLPIRSQSEFLYVSEAGDYFCMLFNEKLKKTLLLSFNKKGGLLDSICIEPTRTWGIDFFEINNGCVISIWRSHNKKEFILFNGRFQTINSKITEVETNPKNKAISFTDSKKNLIFINDNHVYTLRGSSFVEISKSIKNVPAFHKPYAWADRSRNDKHFSGVVDSLGIHVFENNSFHTIPFKGFTLNGDYDQAIKIVQFPNKPQQLFIAVTDLNKIYVYKDKSIYEVKYSNSKNINIVNFYPKVSSWLNDTILLGVLQNKITKFCFNSKLTTVKLEFVDAFEEEDLSMFLSASKLMFERPFLQDIKYFLKDSLFSNRVDLYSIPNSAFSGEIFGVEYLDTKTNVYYYNSGSETKAIDFNKIQPNLTPPKLNILYITYNLEDSIRRLNYYENNIQLPFNFNPLKIFFRGICTTDGNKVKYKYLLTGLDEKWQETNEDMIVYSSLPEGKYTFNVIACNNDGIWNSVPAKISFEVLAPWYRTMIAYVFYVVLLVGGVIYVIRGRTKKLKQDKEKLEKIVLLRTEEIVKQKHIVEEKQKEILDSIKYAKRIQSAHMPTEKYIGKNIDRLKDNS